MEFKLQEELQKQKRGKLENIIATSPKLPEASRSEMETYLDFLKLLLPVLGFPFFEKTQPGDLGVKAQALYVNMSNQDAKGYLTPKGIVVKSSSSVAFSKTEAISGNYGLLRKSLDEQGVLNLKDGKFITDYEFSSPSAAAAVILGYNVNGRDAWKTKEGLTLN